MIVARKTTGHRNFHDDEGAVGESNPPSCRRGDCLPMAILGIAVTKVNAVHILNIRRLLRLRCFMIMAKRSQDGAACSRKALL